MLLRRTMKLPAVHPGPGIIISRTSRAVVSKGAPRFSEENPPPGCANPGSLTMPNRPANAAAAKPGDCSSTVLSFGRQASPAFSSRRSPVILCAHRLIDSRCSAAMERAPHTRIAAVPKNVFMLIGTISILHESCFAHERHSGTGRPAWPRPSGEQDTALPGRQQDSRSRGAQSGWKAFPASAVPFTRRSGTSPTIWCGKASGSKSQTGTNGTLKNSRTSRTNDAPLPANMKAAFIVPMLLLPAKPFPMARDGP